jgi:hypothetical protein
VANAFTIRNMDSLFLYMPMMKKYWKFNLHLCQEHLRNVRVSQFSSCFSWDDCFCESYTSYTRIIQVDLHLYIQDLWRELYILSCQTCVQSNCIYLKNNYITAGNRHKQNSWFCKEIREDNFRFDFNLLLTNRNLSPITFRLPR